MNRAAPSRGGSGDRRLEQVRALVRELHERMTVVASADGSLHSVFPVAISRAEGNALRDWVMHEHAARTVEIGLGYGVSALHICEGLLGIGRPDARHVALDPFQSTRFADCGLQVIEEAGLRDLVEFHPHESQVVLPRFLAERRTFDLAFIDGNHRFDGVFLDLVYLGRLVRGGGIVIVDDYHLRSVAKAVAFCTANLGWTLEDTSRDDELHHWAVLRTSAAPIERSFDHYVDF